MANKRFSTVALRMGLLSVVYLVLGASSCPPKPSEEEGQKYTEGTFETLNSRLTPITYDDKTIKNYGSDYSYAALMVQPKGLSAGDPQKVKNSLGQLFRRWILPTATTASLIVKVYETGTTEPIAVLPFLDIVYDERDTTKAEVQFHAGKQVTPWIKVQPGRTITWSYEIKSSATYDSQIVQQTLKLAENAAKFAGSGGGWVLSQVTQETARKSARDIDAGLNTLLTLKPLTTGTVVLPLLNDPQKRDGMTLELKDVVKGDVAYAVDFKLMRTKSITVDQVSNDGYPVYPRSVEKYTGLQYGPDDSKEKGDRVSNYFKRSDVEKWFSLWPSQSGQAFKKTCGDVLSALQNDLGLNFYDTAAVMWALLNNNYPYMNTPPLQALNCPGDVMGNVMKTVGLTIDAPLAPEPKARTLQVSEMSDSLTLLRRVLKTGDADDGKLIGKDIFMDQVTIDDKTESVFNVGGPLVAPKDIAIIGLRRLDVEKFGCYVAAEGNSVKMAALVKSKKAAAIRRVDVTFNAKIADGKLPSIEIVGVSDAAAEFIAEVRKKRNDKACGEGGGYVEPLAIAGAADHDGGKMVRPERLELPTF